MQVRTLIKLSVVAVFVSAKAAMGASTFTMGFEGIAVGKPQGGSGTAQILDYYDGSPGPAYGVTFSDAALAINSSGAGGPGNFSQANIGSAAAGAIEGSFRLDLDAGLSLTALDFYFNKIEGPGAGFRLLSGGVSVFADTFQSTCSGQVGTDNYCGWVNYDLNDNVLTELKVKGILVTGIEFLAESGAVFDDMTLSTTGSNQTVPEPPSFGLALVGLALFACAARRRAA